MTPSLQRSQPLTFEEFQSKIQHEFIDGSAISPELFAASIEFIEDRGRWESNYALNHKVSLQWQTHKPHSFGTIACLKNEDDRLWQAKAENPRFDSKKDKFQKYETPVESGLRAFTPAVTVRVWFAIASKNNLEDTLPSWVKRAVADGKLNKKSSTDCPKIGGEIPLPEPELRQKPIGFMALGTRSKTVCAMPSSKDGSNLQDGLKSASQAETSMDYSPWGYSPTQVATPETRPFTEDGTETVIASESSPIANGSTPSRTSYQGRSFWKWIELHPDIPIDILEGAAFLKKGGAA